MKPLGSFIKGRVVADILLGDTAIATTNGFHGYD